MDQWKKLLLSLSTRQRISIILAAILVGVLVFSFSHWRRERDFKPLYTGIAPEDAGAIVEKLKENAVEYRLSDSGSSILVPSAKVAEARLQMASAGLPKTGRMGFELFDKTTLGATDFTEHVNLRRALEGELERSIKTIAEVEQARVHLTFPKDSVFLESRLPAKASVLMRLRPGAQLSPANVTAIRHLIASAVEGLLPDAVSVLDIHGNLLSRPPRSMDDGQPSDEAIEYRRKIERDLLAKISSTLEPLLGKDKFRAGVSVECDFTSGEQSEETYDPERSVMVSSQKTEESNAAAGAAGVPGTASNLPRPAARPAGSGTAVSRRSETIAYQSSKTVRRLRLPQGGVKRVSASILLDQAVRWEGQPGNLQMVLVPPSQESLRAIRELVSGVIGLTPARGDQLVIETLPFESTLQMQPPGVAPPASSSPGPETKVSPLQFVREHALYFAAGALLLVLLLLAGIMLFRKALRKKRKVTMAASLPSGTADAPQEQALPASGSTQNELTGDQRRTNLIAQAQESMKAASTARIETLVESVRQNVTEDADLAAGVLRTWLQEQK
ncbi:MAG: flagellar basal-body MS-ring/collar protein FliF [Bryobacteraceae bacterium]